jgi:hypothetical protein
MSVEVSLYIVSHAFILYRLVCPHSSPYSQLFIFSSSPTTDLHDQQSCDVNDSFVKAENLQCGGWSDEEQLLFIRPEAADLWKQLNEFDKALHVEGPPGTGKSTIAWAWACLQAKEKSILWVHRDHMSKGRVAYLSNDGIVSFSAKADSLCSFIDNAAADIVIVDGLTKDSKDLMGAALVWSDNDSQTSRKSVIVSSSQFVAPGEDYQANGVLEFSMPSWTLCQYQSACRNDEFYKDIETRMGPGDEKEEIIMNKFFAAGASARWMFAFDYETLVTKEIPTYIAKINDAKVLLAGMGGDRSLTTVNHLCMVNKDRKGFIVSEFAMRLIAEKCEQSFIAEASAFAKKFKNPAFDGWVFELDFLLRLRLADDSDHSIVVFDDKAEEEQWTVSSRESFDNPSDLSQIQLADGMWLIPKRWNQGGYDAVQVLENGGLRFVQVTRGATHSLKLDYFAMFITEVVKQRQVTSVEVVFVVPFGSADEFNPPSHAQTRGSLSQWTWKLADLRVVQLKRAGRGQ